MEVVQLKETQDDSLEMILACSSEGPKKVENSPSGRFCRVGFI